MWVNGAAVTTVSTPPTLKVTNATAESLSVVALILMVSPAVTLDPAAGSVILTLITVTFRTILIRFASVTEPPELSVAVALISNAGGLSAEVNGTKYIMA